MVCESNSFFFFINPSSFFKGNLFVYFTGRHANSFPIFTCFMPFCSIEFDSYNRDIYNAFCKPDSEFYYPQCSCGYPETITVLRGLASFISLMVPSLSLKITY